MEAGHTTHRSEPFDKQQLQRLESEDIDAWKHVVLELLAVVSGGVLLMAATVAWILTR